MLVGGTLTGSQNVISGNLGSGIGITGGSATQILGNFIGTTADGISPLGNGGGINLVGASGNVIGGSTIAARNIISGSTVGYGIAVQGAGSTANLIEGNFVGTDVSGSVKRGNAVAGVLLQDAAGNTLRSNVISGNGAHGVYILGSTPTTDVTNLIESNYIGTDATGTQDLGNTLMGIRILRGTGSVVRGNVISGNDNNNIIVDALGSEVLIEGNLIGTDASGNAALQTHVGLPGVGITLGGRNNIVRGNVISANPVYGVRIDGLNVPDGRGSGNVLQDNLIGVGLDGVTPLGNSRYGIRIDRGASLNTVGASGTDPASDTTANVIAFNGQEGVRIVDDSSTGNVVRGNSIHSNGGLGIDLGGDGVTANDVGDGDTGPNQRQNVPELKAVRAGATTLIVGMLSSVPGNSFTIDFYANDQLDASGYGEGQRWLGSISVQTNSQGFAAFREQLVASSIAGELITATATDENGNTSEFSGGFMTTGESNGKIIVGGGPSDDVVTLVQDGMQIIINGETMVFAADGSTEIAVYLLAGNDTLTSDLSNHTFVDGGDGDDHMTLGSGNDVILGGSGNDILDGGVGIDTVNGGVGNDVIQVRINQAEFDSLTGGDGLDRVVNIGGGHVVLNSFNLQGDIEEFDAGGRRIRGNAQANRFDFRGVQLINVDSILGENGNDIIFASTLTHDVTYDGGDGNDTLYGQGLRDILLGGQGDDTIFGGDDVDLINGGSGRNDIWSGAGDDRIVLEYDSTNRVHDFVGGGHDAFVFAKKPKKLDGVITSYFNAADVDGDGQVDDLVGQLWNNINLEILDTVMSQLNVDDFL